MILKNMPDRPPKRMPFSAMMIGLVAKHIASPIFGLPEGSFSPGDAN